MWSETVGGECEFLEGACAVPLECGRDNVSLVV